MPSLTRSAYLASPKVLSLTRRTAVYGPVRTVVWEGRVGNRSPYPDPTSLSTAFQVFADE